MNEARTTFKAGRRHGDNIIKMITSRALVPLPPAPARAVMTGIAQVTGTAMTPQTNPVIRDVVTGHAR